jgi:hypothetical protein
VLSDNAGCRHSFRSRFEWKHGGITRKTIRLFEKLVREFPNATYFAKLDCDARLVRNESEILAQLNQSDYFGSCAASSHWASQGRALVYRLPGKRPVPYRYAQGGAYFLHSRVVWRVLTKAASFVHLSKNFHNWEDAMIGMSAAVAHVNITCAPISTISKPQHMVATTSIIHPVK